MVSPQHGDTRGGPHPISDAMSFRLESNSREVRGQNSNGCPFSTKIKLNTKIYLYMFGVSCGAQKLLCAYCNKQHNKIFAAHRPLKARREVSKDGSTVRRYGTPQFLLRVRYVGTVRLFGMVRVRYVGTVRLFCNGTGTVRRYAV